MKKILAFFIIISIIGSSVFIYIHQEDIKETLTEATLDLYKKITDEDYKERAKTYIGMDYSIDRLLESAIDGVKQRFQGFRLAQKIGSATIGLADKFMDVAITSSNAIAELQTGKTQAIKQWPYDMRDIAKSYVKELQYGKAGIKQINNTVKGFEWAVGKATDTTKYTVKYVSGSDKLAEGSGCV